MDFDTWIQTAWDEHAADPEGVAARLQREGPGRALEEASLLPLARLVHHVHGEHLARWAEGRELLAALAAPHGGGGAAAVHINRLEASLALAGGDAAPRAALVPADQAHVDALTAATLAPHDTPRATALLRRALAAADALAPPPGDALHRALAVSGNNLACTLEDKPQRSDEERTLMILAARAARRHWEQAGTWLEVERAEYRLVRTWLQAGDAVQALAHARECLRVVLAHEAPALERFFAHEALALAARAAGETPTADHALAAARADFDALAADDQGWCRATLDTLQAASGGASASAGAAPR
jgi:hypothetical protein